MKVIFCGQFHDASGYGNAARNYLKAFDKNNIREKIDFFIDSISFETIKGDFLSNAEKALIDEYSLPQEKAHELIQSKDYYFISFHTPDIPALGKKDESLNHYGKSTLRCSVGCFDWRFLPPTLFTSHASRRAIQPGSR